jgi:hypothetical protein
MIEPETVTALIEMKEELEKAQDILHRIRLDAKGELLDAPAEAHRCVTHVLGLVESILAMGR